MTTKLYQDFPTVDDEKFDFGDQVYVDWLIDLIESSPKPYRLAINRKLGTGKSTIINDITAKFESSEKIKVVYIDLWKLDKDSSRRSTLYKLKESLKLPKKLKEQVENLLYGTSTKTLKHKPIQVNLDWKGTLILAVPTLLIVLLCLFLLLGFNNLVVSHQEEPKDFYIETAFAVALLTLLYQAGVNIVNKFVISYQRVAQRNSIVGSEEFEKYLGDILIKAKDIKNKHLLIVFDNIDRAHQHTVQEILSGITAFFQSRKALDSNKDFSILVPFDLTCEGLDKKDISKFFDAVIPLPELIQADFYEYSFSLLEKSDLKIDEASIKEIAELISSSCHSLRDVKQFINKFNSKFYLAKKLEEKSNSVDEKYLPLGYISNHPVVLAKILICEDICPGIVFQLIQQSCSVETFFQTIGKVYLVSTLDRAPNQHELSLTKFLRETAKIPSEIEADLDFERFYYFKLPYSFLGVKGGSEIFRCLSNCDSVGLQKYLEPRQDQYSLTEFITVIQGIIKHYTNPLRKPKLWNVFNTLCDYYQNRNLILSLDFKKDLVKLASDQFDYFFKCGLTVDRIQQITLDTNNIDLWVKLDTRFKQMQQTEADKLRKPENWEIEYLCAIIKQQDGIQRSGIDSNHINLNHLMSKPVENAMLSNFQESLISLEHINQLFAKLDTSLDIPNDVDIKYIEKIVKSRLSNTDSRHVPSLVRGYIINTPSFIAGQGINFSKEKFILTLGLFSGLMEDGEANLGNDSVWYAAISNLSGNFNSIANLQSNGLEVLALLIIIDSKIGYKFKTKYPALAGHAQSLFSRTKVVNESGLATLSKYLGGWYWIIELLENIAVNKEVVLSKIQEPSILEFLFKQKDKRLVKYFKNKVGTFFNLQVIERIFPQLEFQSEDQIDQKFILEFIRSRPEYSSSSLRKYCFQNYKNLEGHFDEFDQIIRYELDTGDTLDNLNHLKLALVGDSNMNGLNSFHSKICYQLETKTSSKDLMLFDFLLSFSKIKDIQDYSLERIFNLGLDKAISQQTNIDQVRTLLDAIFNAFEDRPGMLRFESLKNNLVNCLNRELNQDEKHSYIQKINTILSTL